MGVPSKCTMVRTMGRSAYTLKVLSGSNKTQNPKLHTTGRRSTQSGEHCNKRRKRLYSVSIRKALTETRKFSALSVKPDLCP